MPAPVFIRPIVGQNVSSEADVAELNRVVESLYGTANPEDRERAEDAANRADEEADRATGQANIATTQAGIATTRASEAGVARDQAVAAALVNSETPIVFALPSLPDAAWPENSVVILQTGPGAHVLRVEAGAWEPKGWIGEILFDDEPTMRVYDGYGFEEGTIIRTRKENFAYQAANSGASDHHVTMAGGVKLYALPGADGYASIMAFGDTSVGADHTAALSAAIKSNLPLDWCGRSYRITAAISHDLTEAVIWRAKKARLVYDPPSHSEYALFLRDTIGVDIYIDGLRVDGQKTCNRPVRIENNTSMETASTLIATNFHVKGAKRLASFSGGSGLFIRGAFHSVTLNGGSIKDCELPEGQGDPGNSGMQGIGVSWFGTDSYVRRVTLDGTSIDKVYSSDPAYLVDQDGLSYFAPDDPSGNGKLDSLLVVRGGALFKNCYARSIKGQVRHVHVEDARFIRDEGLSGANSVEVENQSGSFAYDRCVCDYANGHVPRTVFGAGSAGRVRAGGSVKHCEVYVDETTELHIFFGSSAIATDAFSRFVVADNQINCAVERFVDFRTNGTKSQLTVEDNWVKEIAPSTFAGLMGERNLVYVRTVGAAPYYAYVHANRNIYEGNELAHVVRDTVPGSGMKADVSSYGNRGFVDDWNAPAGLNTPQQIQAIVARLTSLEGGNNRGSFGIQTKIVAASATETINCRAANASFVLIQISESHNTYALISVGASAVNVSTGSAVAVGATSNPASAAWNIWRSGQGEISIQNTTGTTRSVSAFVFAPN